MGHRLGAQGGRLIMSAKLRLTVWIAVMMLLLSLIMLVFILWVDQQGLIDDSAERLVETVTYYKQKFETAYSEINWEDVDFYTHGVYCAFFDENGSLLRGITVDGLNLNDIPFDLYKVQTTTIDGDEFYIYDAYLTTLDGQEIWIRGIVPENDDSGTAHTIMVMTIMLLPILLLVSVIGGWIISKRAFDPVEKITQTANAINDGNDLSLRIKLDKAPSEMTALSETFNGMFDRLERSFSAEKQFTSDASHELRTPITVIKASCSHAKRKNSTREEFIETLDIIDEQADNMSSLVNHLLSLTRLQQGTDRYPLAEGDLSELVGEVCEDYIPEARRGIVLHTDIAVGIKARFNTQLFASLIQNLLQNAYRYGKENGNIWLTLCQTDGKANLTVRDDGIGMTAEEQEKVWQRFWQADASRSENSGSGLGLPLVKEITELHGGTVTLRSEPDVGSCFTVVF